MSRVVQRVAAGPGAADQVVVDQSAAHLRGESGELQLAQPAWSGRGSVQRRWLKRCGVAGFSFFLLKGLFWLTVPALLAYLAQR